MSGGLGVYANGARKARLAAGAKGPPSPGVDADIDDENDRVLGMKSSISRRRVTEIYINLVGNIIPLSTMSASMFLGIGHKAVITTP